MKHAIRNYFPLFVLLVLVSCAAQPPITPQSPLAQPPERIPVPPLPLPDETGMERAIRLIRTNSPEIQKFFIQDERRVIHVRGELLNKDGKVEFEIAYEVYMPFLPEISTSGQLYIDFTVKELETGTVVQDYFSWSIPASNAGILLSFDDDHEKVWEAWLDTLEKYNARATFFVHKWSPFSEKALERGHDIGFHTHRHFNLRNVCLDVFFEEVSYNPDEFRVGRPMAFAYPYGFWAEWMHEKLLKNFSILRGYGVHFRLYSFDAISNSFIIATAIDNILYRDDTEFERTLTRMLWAAKFLGRVLPLTTHNISDTAAWGIKPCRLLFLLETARGLNLNFYRFSDF